MCTAEKQGTTTEDVYLFLEEREQKQNLLTYLRNTKRETSI